MPNREVHLKRWQAVGALVLLTLAYVLAIVLVQRETQHRTDANRALIDFQVKQRAELTYTSCLDQNERHDATIKRLDEVLMKAIENDPSREGALRQTRGSTVFLIEALAPHQNCEQIVLDRFGYVPKLPPSPDTSGDEE